MGSEVKLLLPYSLAILLSLSSSSNLDKPPSLSLSDTLYPIKKIHPKKKMHVFRFSSLERKETERKRDNKKVDL
jgi:hypothetical protein